MSCPRSLLLPLSILRVVCMIHRADRADEIIACLAEHEFKQIENTLGHSFPEPAHLSLIEGQLSPSPKVIHLEPLRSIRKRGIFQEIKMIYQEKPGSLDR